MGLALYDTLARDKRAFAPADPRRVTMYVCGPTVYDHAHIGNFRAAVVFDLLFRVLRLHYGDGAVIYARNITDIDDKIIRRAKETGEPIGEITARYAQVYRDETRALNILPPTLEPAATGHIGDMIALVEKLLAGGFAYAAEEHVLFAVDRYKDYGALSGVDRDEMIAGARVDVAPYKANPADFVLWKPSAADEPGWPSPWGRGRPGWHLECSAMIGKALGTTIDIHGGGLDLRFPHHENEIAQSRCAHGGAPLARYWIHNGFLNMGADKMSKSLGNVALPRDLLRKWPGEVLRFALLTAHYRQPLEWTDRLLEQSKSQLDRFYRMLGEAPGQAAPAPPASVLLALDDDLNTPEAIAGLHELRDIAAQMTGEAKTRAVASLKAAGELMGLFSNEPEAWFRAEPGEGPQAEEIDRLLAERADDRKARDFARADAIRDRLFESGILIEDGPHGTSWRRA
ncbi:MAG: cysteine--tRNA ligase [Parvularculaceae bacterium]|nr:cysteine--tRNA ligase [Parvularculaceae bacterium]